MIATTLLSADMIQQTNNLQRNSLEPKPFSLITKATLFHAAYPPLQKQNSPRKNSDRSHDPPGIGGSNKREIRNYNKLGGAIGGSIKERERETIKKIIGGSKERQK